MENKIINYINQTPENTNPSVLATLLGELKVPKPLTYDYMPEGYPSKSVQTVTLLEEQEVAFSPNGETMEVVLPIGELQDGQQLTVIWDNVSYSTTVTLFRDLYPIFGNLGLAGLGANTGEPFIYIDKGLGNELWGTTDTSASHTISVKKMGEIVTPMAEEFLPNIPADKLPTGGVTTLHINVTAINTETKEPTFTADKTPVEMLRASANGSIWCVISFAAGLMGEEAVSFGVPPTWGAGAPTFGTSVSIRHQEGGNNEISDVVTSELPNTWILDLSGFGG